MGSLEPDLILLGELGELPSSLILALGRLNPLPVDVAK